RIEGAGGVTLVMISKQKLPFEFLAGLFRSAWIFYSIRFSHLGTDDIRHPELLLHPERHRFQERRKSGRRIVEIGLEQSIELQQWLVIEAHVIQLFGRDAGFAQTVGYGLHRKVVIVLDASEALFLSS